MTDFTELCALAFHGERVAARRLARQRGISEEAALHATLALVAGAAGLAALCVQRHALQAAAQARSDQRGAARSQAKARHALRHEGAATPWRGWFDGSAHPNPGLCGIGALLLGPAGERIAVSRAIGYGNSSEAEYQALIALLETARDAGARCLTVYGDSQVVINDLAASEAASAPALRELRAAAALLIASQGAVTLRWIPRHKNGAADALSQQARQRA
jgi:ribonuclease HI